ncbi:MAG: hypothetical protein AB8U25_03880 [Rickettsiales endosymbiont of Dermacentor nuttalli]
MNHEYKAADLLLAMCPKYYKLYIHYNLFGEPVITRYWIGKFNRKSSTNHIVVSIDKLDFKYFFIKLATILSNLSIETTKRV